MNTVFVRYVHSAGSKKVTKSLDAKIGRDINEKNIVLLLGETFGILPTVSRKMMPQTICL